jgi:hypothetical protein
MADLDTDIDTEEDVQLTLFQSQELCKTDKLYLSKQMGYDFQADVHTDLFANYLQLKPDVALTEQSKQKDRLVLWFRGAFKTTSIVVEIVQLILNYPNIRILLMQGTIKNTQGLLGEIKSHFDGTNPKSNIPTLFPERCQTTKRLGTSNAFTVLGRTQVFKEGTVTVASPKSVKAGTHFDAGFFDDLIHEQNFRNHELVQKAISDFNTYVPLIDPGGYRYVTGTRYTFGDLYEWIIRRNADPETGGTWQISKRACWTVNSDGSKTLAFPRREISGGKFVGHTLEYLLSKQADDPEMFAAQYLNQPISTQSQLFTEAVMLSHVRTNVQISPNSWEIELGAKTLFVDVATSGNNDDSVVLCGQQDGFNRIYVTDGVGGVWDVFQLGMVIITQALIHRPVRIILEGSAAGTVFKNYLDLLAKDKGLMLPIELVKVSNQKDAKHIRISAVSGALKQNKFFFLAGLPCWAKLLEQSCGYPRMRHDDYPDTMAIMYQYLSVNGSSVQIVKSVASYLMAQPATPFFVQEEKSTLGQESCGSDFCE